MGTDEAGACDGASPLNPVIDEFKGTWLALGRMAPERLSALRRVATIEIIGSSTRIEGATSL